MHPNLIRSLTGTPDQPVLTFRRRYRADPAQVRDACTSTDRLARWFGQVSGAPAAVGDRFAALLGGDPADAAEGQVLQSLARALDAANPAAPPDERIEADAVQRWRTITRAPLQLERVLPAPVDRVWSALATPEGLRTWWWRHWSDVRVDADVRLGGTYRIEAPGAGIAVAGTYLVVQAPSQLAFTWRWQDGQGTSTDEAVQIALDSEGDTTRMILRHTGPWSDHAPSQSYREGWLFVLDELTNILAARQ